MNPGDRPRKALLTTIGAAVAIAAATTLVVASDTSPAGADELERFASCEALAQWAPDQGVDADVAENGSADVAKATEGGGASGSGTTGGDGAAPVAAPDATSAPSTAAAQRTADETATGAELAATDDDTNVIVQGVDELDVIDRLDPQHVLVSAASRLSIVDLVDDQLVANLPTGFDVQITYDAEDHIAWVVGPDDDSGRLTVTRVSVTGTTLREDASWATDGWLVDARRVGDRLHLVAADGFDGVAEDQATAAVPFAEGPVPCDQVLHPVTTSDPTATLLVTLPATGPLEPEHATEVVGSGEFVHVTTDAAYLATPLYGDTVQTSIHRFDLDTLALTGSGRVDGSLLNEFSMSDRDGFLRLAVTAEGGGSGRAIEGDVIMPEAVPGEGTTGRDPAILPAPVAPATAPAALNEIVVLDTDGALDVVGRTERFGHPGETLQGVRFDGAVAYAVTFLQTDPFYVVDLDDPRAPRVAGEVQLPGFSSYLHPVGDGLVAGFGPGDDGAIEVKLFDVHDTAHPVVVDSLSLGDESPVAWDHHAFVDLGDGRFAVPGTTYRELRPTGCTAARQQELQEQDARLQDELSSLYARDVLDEAGRRRMQELEEQTGSLYADGCIYPSSAPVSSVVVVDTTGGELRLVQRLGEARGDEGASRVTPTDDGWALLIGNHWVVLDGTSGDQVADLELGPDQPAYPIDDVGGGRAAAATAGPIVID
jgi:uncharacterized secreted protein with C-terminal beta-propeller domain